MVSCVGLKMDFLIVYDKRPRPSAEPFGAFSFSPAAYAGLRFRCTNPLVRSIRQCVPAHFLNINTLADTRRCLLYAILAYAKLGNMSILKKVESTIK